jgi:hypothetical protein
LKLQIFAHNSLIFLHILVYWVWLMKNQALIWRFWPRIKHIKIKNMNMETSIWARSRSCQASIHVPDFITRVEEQIWTLARPWIYCFHLLFFKQVWIRSS